MKLALIYPPACDPTAPYPAVPALTGFLRQHGVEVLPIDANLGAFRYLLRRGPLETLAERVEDALARLQRRGTLDHASQLHYLALWRARGDAWTAPAAIEAAMALLRDPDGFYDPEAYASAMDTVNAALRLISAAHYPVQVDFTAYRSPFALTSAEEVRHDAEPQQNPFHGYLARVLLPALRRAKPDAIGLSICFPGQLAPAYAFAQIIKQALPDVHLVTGGPAITQILLRLHGTGLRQALGAFDSAVVFEGEHTLLALCQALDRGAEPHLRSIPNVITRDPLQGARYLPGAPSLDLHTLPAPDFDGLPLDQYLAPHLLLPYDCTRGCYWGRCAFCHYGLTAAGTARYRERAVVTMVEHLAALSARYDTRYFYLAQDSIAPKTLVQLSEALARAGLDLRWGTDLRPERYLTKERCQVLRRGGAVACSLGVESGSQRVLELIDKGISVHAAGQTIQHLAQAGIAAEVMSFTDFPSETYAEARETVSFLERFSTDIAAFIVGEFDLSQGSRVARHPEQFGLREVWRIRGDALGTALFYAESRASKRAPDRARLERAIDQLAAGWWLHRYPWLGSLSTAHTLFYYDRFGPSVLKDLAGRVRGGVMGAVSQVRRSRFDLNEMARAEEREARIWFQLTHVRREISRQAYAALALNAPSAVARPGWYQVSPGRTPQKVAAYRSTTRKKAKPRTR